MLGLGLTELRHQMHLSVLLLLLLVVLLALLMTMTTMMTFDIPVRKERPIGSRPSAKRQGGRGLGSAHSCLCMQARVTTSPRLLDQYIICLHCYYCYYDCYCYCCCYYCYCYYDY